MFEPKVIPQGHVPTDLQRQIIELLDINGIEWTFVDIAGGCNALVVSEALRRTGFRQVVCTNCDDEEDKTVFVVDEFPGCRFDCAFFAIFEERWGEVVFTSNDAYDFLNIARFLTQHDSDPFEHRLMDGTAVITMFHEAEGR